MKASRTEIVVILVEPNDSKNIGAAARAMANLGVLSLRLVAPRDFDRERAAVTACWATGVLDRLEIFSDLAAAVADLHEVVGFSARGGKNRGTPSDLRDWVASGVGGPRLGLLFGSEDIGLRDEHTALCHELVRLPSSGDYPSFNLAQAVLLALYELSRAELVPAANAAKQAVEQTQYEQLDRLLDEVLTLSGFYKRTTPRNLPSAIAHLFRRARADRREMQLLLGIFGRIERTIKGRLAQPRKAAREAFDAPFPPWPE